MQFDLPHVPGEHTALVKVADTDKEHIRHLVHSDELDTGDVTANNSKGILKIKEISCVRASTLWLFL